MVEVLHTSLHDFYKDIADKKVFLFGAGERAVHTYEVCNLKGKVEAVVDNNCRLHGTKWNCNGGDIPVIGITALVRCVQKLGKENIIILITSGFYTMDIIEQLDTIADLNGVRCYTSILLFSFYEEQKFDFTEGIHKIPKKIHYCWFGEKEIPAHLQKYIDTWKRFCPDYEIKRWDEKNYDVTINRYMKEAYECQKWGFVPDYARLDIIYREGGVYLDTDVELLNSLDCFLNDDMFCSFMEYASFNIGSGFGAIKGLDIIKDLRDAYNDISFFDENGNMNLTPCRKYQNPIFLKYGFSLENRYQKRGNIVVYPSEVLAPLGAFGISECWTNKTVAVHHTEVSWGEVKQKRALERCREGLMKRIAM